MRATPEEIREARRLFADSSDFEDGVPDHGLAWWQVWFMLFTVGTCVLGTWVVWTYIVVDTLRSMGVI